MERFIPARAGIDIGVGYDTLTCEVRGVSVGGEIKDAVANGMNVAADTTVIETKEQMSEKLDVSVEANGHYGLFSAEGRFGLAQQCAYSAQSTYVVVKCVVENAFKSFERPALFPEASEMFVKNGPDQFKTSYGNGFVRGLRTGGELFAVFQVTYESSEKQSTVSASMRAEVQGLIAGGSVSASMKKSETFAAENKNIRAVFYQRAGRDNDISPVTDPSDIATRLKGFPTFAHAAPVGYLAQISDYQVLALPEFDRLGYQQRIDALEDYARLKMKYCSTREEIDLVRKNREIFSTDYTDGDLGKLYDLYTLAINKLNRHARSVASREIEPDLFEPAKSDPSLANLPTFLFTKKAPDSDLVEVMDVTMMSVETAKQKLIEQGLTPTSNAISVTADSGKPTNIVITQYPPKGSPVSKRAPVEITYYYVPSERFKWIVRGSIPMERYQNFVGLFKNAGT